MAKYAVKMKPSAEKELDRLSGKLNARIFSRLESLAFDPRPPGCKKLKGGDNEWRLRIGDYRAVYTLWATIRIPGQRQLLRQHRRLAYEFGKN